MMRTPDSGGMDLLCMALDVVKLYQLVDIIGSCISALIIREY